MEQLVRLSTHVQWHCYCRLYISEGSIPTVLYCGILSSRPLFSAFIVKKFTHYIILNYQVTKKSLHHQQPWVEINQILFDASGEAVPVCSWLLALVL